MNSAIALASVLSVIITTGNSLSCIQCSGFSDIPCTGSSQNCSSSNDVCATTRIRNTGYLWNSFYFIRSCINTTECGKSGTVSSLYVKTSSSTTCCNTDNCTPSIPSMPVENNTANGLACPSYIETILEPCDIKNHTQCTGDQNYCIRYSTSTTLGSTKSSLLFGGCATENVCSTTTSYISAPGMTMEVKRSCNNNASDLYHNWITTYLSILFILFGIVFHSSNFL
ncbi:phospholipase A2 inhibitor and Ly6/PLAUR domain-containing protein-like [Rhinophrynus dorsalis]